MSHIIHTADTRGAANHGWLNAHHSFSFASYHDATRMHFGLLRVLNDDTVAPGMGFGQHPHDNMEIITIPLSGAVEHADSMGNKGVIKTGDVQVMSTGTGIYHSEYNAHKDQPLKLLQIWVFPRQRGVTPRYGQASFDPADRKNKFQTLVSPGPTDTGLWIHQDAWFSLADFDAGFTTDYKIKKEGNGVYAFVISGDLTIQSQLLHPRDAMGIWDTPSLSITAESASTLLLLEVPMD
jgi:redox-sensitive bicupin YhaK (pirin superfamily)